MVRQIHNDLAIKRFPSPLMSIDPAHVYWENVTHKKNIANISYGCHSLGVTQFMHGFNGIYTKEISQYLDYHLEQGKSEGFESCDRPIVRKRPIWVKIGDVLYRVTLKFDGWPWKTKGHLSFAVSSFVQHFIAIGEFKLELQSGNAQFGSNSTIFRAVWPWNLTYDLEKQ